MKLLNEGPISFSFSPCKVVILTGLSNPTHCRLSKAQSGLLKTLEIPDTWKVDLNFPFVEKSLQTRDVSLAYASAANAWQFCTYLLPSFKRKALPHWLNLEQSCDRLLVIAGSCGVQFLSVIMKTVSANANIRCLALGPVSLTMPSVPTTTVQGKRDFLSRGFVTKSDFLVPKVGHMDYWNSKSVTKIVKEWVNDNTLKL